MPRPTPLSIRIAAKAEQERECLIWKGATDKKGYGMVWVTPTGCMLVHRATWIDHNGPIPRGMIVMHACDRPPCINLSHLSLGTQTDNQRDAVQKGRHVRGERNGTAILTNAQVREIKQRLAAGESPNRIAPGYGMSKSAIWSIKTGRKWKHVT